MSDPKTWQRLGKVAAAAIDWSSLDERSIDPYLIWADITGFGGAALESSQVDRAKASLQVALELDVAPDAEDRWPDIGVQYAQAVDLGKVGYATAEVEVAALRQLLDHPRVRRLEIGFVNAGPALDVKQTKEPEPVAGPVVAVIDFGCAFAHERFRHKIGDEWKSRIAYLWDQGDDSADRSPDAPWQPVHGQRRGRELTGSAIDQLLARHQAGGRIDEDAVYRAARYGDVAARLTHGTHVLDLAAGAAPDSAIEREPKIIFVQLPARAVEDTSGGSMVTCVIDALRYILDRTRPKDQRKRTGGPLVINLSYGSMAGPHDGSTLLESAMDALIAESRQSDEAGNRRRYLEIVLPAGNNFESDGHARMNLTAERPSRTLQWQVQPDDSTDTFLELWYSKAAAGRLEVRVTPPGGSTCQVLINQAMALRLSPDTPPVAAVIHRTHVASGLNDAMALVALAPTAARGGAVPLAIPGVWQVDVSLTSDAVGADSVEVFAWIERDDPTIGSRGSPRQSTFVRNHPKLPRNQDCSKGSMVQRSITCNSIANGANTLVVGGCVGRGVGFELARYSSAGPPRRSRPNQEWPDLVAVSEESLALFGVVAAGTRSGIRERMNGTSVAAPQVSRALIQMFFPPVGVLAHVPDQVKNPKVVQRPAPGAQSWTSKPNGMLLLEPAADPAAPRNRVGRGRLAR